MKIFWQQQIVEPLLSLPWHFATVAVAFTLIGIAVCALVVYRKQLRWQHETEERLEDAIQTRTFELQVTLTELAEKNRALEEQNTLDALTGIRNRAYFDKKLQAELKRSRREQRPLGLVILDIDHFKQINDEHGHVAGDAVIRGLAQRLAQLLKRSSDHVCRYGGEEFALILPNTDAEGVLALAEQIREHVESAPFTTEIGDLPVHISAGCYSAIPTPDTLNTEFIHAADQALYQAKRGGRNQVQLFPSKALDSSETGSSGEVSDELIE